VIARFPPALTNMPSFSANLRWGSQGRMDRSLRVGAFAQPGKRSMEVPDVFEEGT